MLRLALIGHGSRHAPRAVRKRKDHGTRSVPTTFKSIIKSELFMHTPHII